MGKETKFSQAVAMMGKINNIYLWPSIAGTLVQYAGRTVLRKLGAAPASDTLAKAQRAEAEAWCAQVAISPGEAMEKIGLAGKIVDPGERHGQEFRRAEARIESFEIPFREMKLAGAADLGLLYSVIQASGARNIVETGVALGWSSLAILLLLEEYGEGRLISIDMPYLTLRADEDWVGLAVPPRLYARWKLLRMPDRFGLPKAFAAMPDVDFVHYDSDKSCKGRLWAYPYIWTKLPAGGILMSDDISDNMAWRDFCEQNAIDMSVVRHGGKFVGLARK